MKVFLSSTYVDLIEHRKAAHVENHPRIFHEFTNTSTPIREFVVLFVDGFSEQPISGEPNAPCS